MMVRCLLTSLAYRCQRNVVRSFIHTKKPGITSVVDITRQNSFLCSKNIYCKRAKGILVKLRRRDFDTRKENNVSVQFHDLNERTGRSRVIYVV